MTRGMLILIAAFLSACSPLGTFNALVPKEGGVALTARGEAYGANPRQRIDVYAPRRRKAGAALPIIVFIYGGSWQSGSKDGYAFAARALAARGFVVAVPDYRLVPTTRFPGFLEDCAAAVKWVRANSARHGGDRDRIVLMGHSAGAYNAAMLALDVRYLGTDRDAVRGLIALAGPFDFLPLDGPVTRAVFGNAGDLAATQPVSFASAGDPPALLLHGAKDTTVHPRNSAALARGLRAAGVEAEIVRYPGLGHIGILTALSAPFRGRAPVLADSVRFARRVTAAR